MSPSLKAGYIIIQFITKMPEGRCRSEETIKSIIEALVSVTKLITKNKKQGTVQSFF